MPKRPAGSSQGGKGPNEEDEALYREANELCAVKVDI